MVYNGKMNHGNIRQEKLNFLLRSAASRMRIHKTALNNSPNNLIKVIYSMDLTKLKF